MSQNRPDSASAAPGVTAGKWGVGRPKNGPAVRPTVIGGVLLSLAFFGGLVGWAALAPLESAAIAPASVSVDSNRKTVQHLEGGIIGKILVRDGDVVRIGQPLLRLDETQARAALELLQLRKITLTALLARLRSERDGRTGIVFPDWLLNALADAKVKEAVSGQVSIFNVRQELIRGQISIHERRMLQLAEEIKGLRGQILSEKSQLRLIEEEEADVKELFSKGLARKPRLLSLQRRKAEIVGSRARNLAEIARAGQKIEEAKLQINDLRTEHQKEIVLQLRETQTELYDIAERIRAAEDVLARMEIRAPISGIIVGMQVHTPGGVIAPGEKLMDIVPSNDRLMIEAKVDPKDIDIVRPGLSAKVQLTAFGSRNVMPIEGTVVSISADRLLDERTGRFYYLARIWLAGDVEKQLNGSRLYPGMPAEVMITTGVRTALEYLMTPLASSLNRSFREQ